MQDARTTKEQTDPHRDSGEAGSRARAGFLAAVVIVGAIVAFAILFWTALS